MSHAGLLCIYTLAALLGLFLHSAGETQTPHHVCAEQSPDLESDSGNGPSHDATHCALCHVFERFSSTLPTDSTGTLATSHESVGVAAPAESFAPPSSLDLLPPSRAPPSVRAATT